MTITGKKFSELTQEQQIATRVPIAGWLVNNVFINPDGKNITLISDTDHMAGSDNENKILLIISSTYPEIVPTTISFIAESTYAVGYTFYFVNWSIYRTVVKIAESPAGDGVTLLPYSEFDCRKVFGVFKCQKTNINEWTVSVIENGEIVSN